MTHWTVLQTEPQFERIVRLLLMRNSVETYMPRVKHRNRIALLFPTYLFAQISESNWSNVRWTPHVTRILMAGNKPARLDETVIRTIRSRETNGIVRLPKRTIPRGHPVQIIVGTFGGHLAIYDGQSRTDRERVLLELLGRKVPIEIPTNHLVPLHLAPPLAP